MLASSFARQVGVTLWTRWSLRRCASVGSDVRVLGHIWIHGEGRVRIGSRVTLDGRNAPVELHALKGATITVGDDVTLGGGTSIESQVRVDIGARTHFGAFCKIIDNHFHPLRGDRRKRPPSAAVFVGEDVELADRAMLLPGVVVEQGARVLPGTLVSRRVPAGSRVGGNPAKVIP